VARDPDQRLIGLFFMALFSSAAIFAPWIAPYGMAEVVGDVWEPPVAGLPAGHRQRSAATCCRG
jgi:ABC-type antimicrobial peptide transport system permease subunit